MTHHKRLSAALSAVLILTLVGLPIPVSAQADDSVRLEGIILGRVYEIDKAKYRAYLQELEKRKGTEDEKRELLDPDDYLLDLPDVSVVARQLSTNARFSGDRTDKNGEYMIRRSPTGAFDFTLVHEGVEYAVRQHLDLNVELSYVAELCFVLDREEKKAWMISEGLHRDSDAPPFVPERCQSALGACLAMLTGTEDGFPRGLLLLLAASGAAGSTIGILSTEQTEASPLRQR